MLISDVGTPDSFHFIAPRNEKDPVVLYLFLSITLLLFRSLLSSWYTNASRQMQRPGHSGGYREGVEDAGHQPRC